MPEASASPKPATKFNWLQIAQLLRPHWKSMSLALVAVVGETATDLLEPWPLKIILDNLLQSKPLPGWLAAIVSHIGQDKLAVLNFAVLAVAVIAVVGAISSYTQKYLTTSVGQWVMHDLRRTLYQHIHHLSLAEHDEKRTGDLISRVDTASCPSCGRTVPRVLGTRRAALVVCGVVYSALAITSAVSLFAPGE